MWSNIVKKVPVKKLDNSQKVQSNASQKRAIPDEPVDNIRYQNVDEEFEKIYSKDVDNSVVEFRNYLEGSLFFAQPNHQLTTELYKFVKYNCYNLNSVEIDVDRYNDDLDRELEEEEEYDSE